MNRKSFIIIMGPQGSGKSTQASLLADYIGYKFISSGKYLRKLEAMLALLSNEKAFIVSGTGDIIEPDDKIVAIGSGGMYALAAAKMLKKYSSLTADEIVKEALTTASEICIYTNDKINIEKIEN